MATNNKRLTWKQILKKYPHQYVGITDIKYDKSGRFESAIVKYSNENASYNDICLAAFRKEVWMKYTTMDEDFQIGVFPV